MPEAVLLVLGALFAAMCLYFCMAASRTPPGRRCRDPLVPSHFLPGEAADIGSHAVDDAENVNFKRRRPVSYLFINSGHVTDDTAPPKFSSGSGTTGAEAGELRAKWQEYNRKQWAQPLSKRGEQQCRLARQAPSAEAQLKEGVLYEYLKHRAVHCFAANNLRCIQTAEHLMKVNCHGNTYTDQLNNQVAKIHLLDSLTPYGTDKCNYHVSTGLQEINAAIGREGARGFWEEPLEKFFWPAGDDALPRTDPHSNRAIKNRMADFVHRVITEMKAILHDETQVGLSEYTALERENMNWRHPEGAREMRPKDCLIVVVGQTPFINSVAAHVAELFGHTSRYIQEKILDVDDVGYMDGFLISLAPHLCAGREGIGAVFPEHLSKSGPSSLEDFPFINYEDKQDQDEVSRADESKSLKSQGQKSSRTGASKSGGKTGRASSPSRGSKSHGKGSTKKQPAPLVHV